MSPRSVAVVSSTPSAPEEPDAAFNTICTRIASESSLVWNSVELFDIYKDLGGSSLTRWTLVNKLSDHFGDDLVILSASGVASVVVSKSRAPVLLKLVNDNDECGTESAIKRISKQIKTEVKQMNVDKSHYNSDLTKASIENTSSETLLTLLSHLSPKLDKSLPACLIGNIVTGILSNRPTLLQIAFGVLMRDSKGQVKEMSQYGVTCSYDEVLTFKKSAAVAATLNTSLQGLSGHDEGMVRTIVDNFDTDISSQNGKLSTHSLAMLIAKPSKYNNVADDGGESIKRLSKSEMTEKKVEYDFNIERYSGPKKPDMPNTQARKTVPPLKVLASKVRPVNRAKEIDFVFFQDMSVSVNYPEYNGYNTKACREQGHKAITKTKAVYLPLIDMKPSDPDTIMTAMTKSQTVTAQCGQDFVVFSGDLQLYKVAVNVTWAYPEQFSNFIVRLGGMHMLMSFVGSIGTLMAGSGLAEIMESTFGGVLKMLSGKKFPQNVRALRIIAEELLRHIFATKTMRSMTDLETVLDEITAKSRTSKLWVDCVIRAVFIILIYVRAEREGDWCLHLAAVKLMMPYFFAAGHINYARYGLYYLRSMEAMPDHEQKKFLKGEHVMRHVPGIWNGIWSDMYIETTFMRYGHGKRGIIGITLKPETLKIWALGLHICSKLEEDLTKLKDAEDRFDESSVHKEELKGRIDADTNDR